METYKNGRNVERSRLSRNRWYARNKESEKARISARAAEIREWFQALKSSLSCSKCGYNRCSAALEFHHRDEKSKEMTPSTTVKNGWSKERILLELEKCDVLCSNCHRELHSGVR